jgi:NADH:ubiquinone reductase (H+-translocating)
MSDRTPAALDDRPHVVIVGAGFGGLACAQALGDTSLRVTIVDRRNYHLFVPLLYQVATAALSPADIAEPIRKVVSRYRNIHVVMAEVTGVDLDGRRVLLLDGGHIPYDRLVLGTGSTYSYFGNEAWADIAPGLKTIENARSIRARLLSAFERAEISDDPREQESLLTVVVIGGGPTGVEVAGAIAELARFTLARDFRRIDPRAARVILVEAGPRILTTFPDELSKFAHRALERLRVEVLTGHKVDKIESGVVTVTGRPILTQTVIWAAGVAASPAASWLRVPSDRLGRISVAPDLAVPDRPGVYALGDTATLKDASAHPLPGLAQVAKQQGAWLGQALIRELVQGSPHGVFRFKNRGNTAIIGRNAAVFDFGTWRLKGFPAWLLWAIVHVYLLVGFEKRLLVSVQWLWRYFTYQRGARLIEDSARTAPPPILAPAPEDVWSSRAVESPPGSVRASTRAEDVRSAEYIARGSGPH